MINPASVGLFAVGGYHDGDGVVVIPMNSTVKISTPLPHPSATKTATIVSAGSEQEATNEETMAAVAEWKLYPMIKSPQPLK